MLIQIFFCCLCLPFFSLGKKCIYTARVGFQPIGPIASNRAPHYASLCGTHGFLSVGPITNENQSKWTAWYCNILIHRNSFWNRNSGHWFRCVV